MKTDKSQLEKIVFIDNYGNKLLLNNTNYVYFQINQYCLNHVYSPFRGNATSVADVHSKDFGFVQKAYLFYLSMHSLDELFYSLYIYQVKLKY